MSEHLEHSQEIPSGPQARPASGIDPDSSPLEDTLDSKESKFEDCKEQSSALFQKSKTEELEDYEEDEEVSAGYDNDNYVDLEASPDEGEDFLNPEDEAILEDDDPLSKWDDILHYDPEAEEPDQLAYLEALAARFSEAEESDEEPEPLYREDIQQVKALCTRPFNTECTRCAQACPHKAISFNDENLPVIEDELCTNCGVCAGICDGFSSVRVTLEDLIHNALDISDQGLAITIACNDMIPLGEDPADNVLLVPCLAALPPAAFSYLLAFGAQVNICCDFELCNHCAVAGSLAPELFSHAIATAESWNEKEIGFVDKVPTQQSIFASVLADAKQANDRRNMFAGLSTTMTEVATGEYRLHSNSSVLDFQERMERLRAAGHIKQHEGTTLEELTASYRIPKYWPRQKLILEAAEENPEIGARIPVWVASISEACQQSHACVDQCPTGARQINEDGKLSYDKSYCIACGACMKVCVHEACDFTEVSALELIQDSEQVS